MNDFFNTEYSYMKEIKGEYDYETISASLTDEMADKILRSIAEGESLKDAANSAGISEHHLGGLLRDKNLKTLSLAFIRAFEHSGWKAYEDLIRAEDKLENDRNASVKRYKALIDAVQWRLQRLKPEIFGQKEFKKISSEMRIVIESNIPEPKLLDDVEVIEGELE